MAGPLGKRRTIGQLRNRLTIQKFPADPDRTKYGNELPDWSTATEITPVFGEVQAVSGRDLFAAGQVQAEVSHKVVMRFRSDLTAKDRLLWLDNGSAVLNVVAILQSVGRANCLDVWCLQET